MRALTLVTWNVLHGIHAVNWSEPALERFPVEAERLQAIATRVASFFANGADVVCLQEVSGDLLALLRAQVGVTALSHQYPRVPSLRKTAPQPLQAPEELLVTLVRDGDARVLEAETFKNDAGKGALSITFGDGVTVLNTHVTFGDQRVEQLRLVQALTTRRCVVAGDFNAAPGLVHEAFGAGFTITAIPEDTPTRLATRSQKGLIIDHVLVRGGELREAKVLTHDGESDHFPVQASVRFP